MKRLKELIKQYEIGFDFWGFILFLAIMIPNFVWYFVPVENDILDIPTMTPVIDRISRIFQFLAVGALCVLRNVDGKTPMNTAKKIAIAVGYVIYITGWTIYFTGHSSNFTVIIITIVPAVMLMIFSSGRRNILAFYAFLMFLIFHSIFAFMNFIVL